MNSPCLVALPSGSVLLLCSVPTWPLEHSSLWTSVAAFSHIVHAPGEAHITYYITRGIFLYGTVISRQTGNQ